MIGAISCGRRKVWRIERMPSARTTRSVGRQRAHASTGACVGVLLALLLEVVAGLVDEDVVERRLDQLQRLDRDPGLVERADDARDVGGAVLDLDQDLLAVLGRQQLAEPGADLAPPRRPSPAPSCSSRWGLPISALSDSGVPSATILPLSMIPTLSASWSASSRYWVVRKTVVPSSLSARTSSQIVLRLTGSRPVVGSSRKSTRGSWTSAAARSSRRCMPPE